MNLSDVDLTFFAWGDTHFGYQQRFGSSDLRAGIIDQMNALPGWPYPPEIGGLVGEPDFVMHCGDIVTDGGDAHMLAVYRYFIRNLRYPHYETLGNHDGGDDFMRYFTGKYGGPSHSFDAQGVHCVSVSGAYDEWEKSTIPDEQLAWLESDIDAVADDNPVILFTHSPLKHQSNVDDILSVLSAKRVILNVAAHTHQPDASVVRGIQCVSLGHCRDHPIDAEYGRSFGVIHIKGNTITALPWRWDLQGWEQGRRWGNHGDEAVPATAQRFRIQATF